MKRILVVTVVLHFTQLSQSQSFVGSPLVKTETGQNVSLVWTLSTSFNTYPDGSSLQIQTGFHSHQSTPLLRFTKIGGERICQNSGDSRLSCVVEGNRVGFTVTGVRETDASRYSCIVSPLGRLSSVDNGGLLYIYKHPTKPAIIGLKDVEIGNKITLTCNSTSQSLPVEFRNLSGIEYSWTSDLSSGNLNPSGNTVTIGPVERGDNGATVTCTTRDQGSSLSVSSSVSINVKFRPGKPKVTVNEITLWERRHDLTLTCSFGPGQDMQDGNPPSDSFTWRNTDTDYMSPVTVSELTINKADLSVSLHDGTWTCIPLNTVGTGGTGQITITVNAEPIALDTTMMLTADVNGELNMTCSFKAKPAANIRWKNSSGGNSLAESLKVVSSSYTNNRYTVTVSTISWLLGSGPIDRCMAGGEYRCSAHNGFGENDVDSPVTTFIAQCAPHLLNRTKDKAAIFGENYTFEAHFIANPKPTNVTSWTFKPQIGTQATLWPPNIKVTEIQGAHQLTFSTAIHINNISESNYGSYLLDMNNSLGGPITLKFVLSPEGPPHKPLNLREVYITAVSLRLSWQAGFSGGFPQTFTVLYRAEGERDELSADVDHPPDVSTGDVIIFKLKDPETILPNAVYHIRIRAQNGYNGGSVVHGNPIESRTKVRPVMSEPVIEFNSSHAVIKTIIQNTESVTHIITTICSKEDVSICSQQNISVVQSDVTIVLEIQVQARQYNVSFTLYDRDDEVNKSSVVIASRRRASILRVIVGSTVGAVLLTVIVVIMIVMWRKGILCKTGQDKKLRPRATQQIVVYENVNPQVPVPPQPSEEDATNQYEGLSDTFIPVVEPSFYDGLQPQNEDGSSGGRQLTHHVTGEQEPAYQDVL